MLLVKVLSKKFLKLVKYLQIYRFVIYFYYVESNTSSMPSKMLRTCDQDSGRSSCSAASITLSPLMDFHKFESTKPGRTQDLTSDLKVSTHPRNSVNIIKSPNEREPFPSCILPRNHRKPAFSLFDVQRKGNLSNSHSTNNIACSTQIEAFSTNAISTSAINDDFKTTKQSAINTNFRRGKPVQRAASRLYKADNLRGKEGCVGPEFIVRASQAAKHIDLSISSASEKRNLHVVLLNGQKVEIVCDPNIVTAGHIFEALVYSEKYEHNFMLGVAVLISGDFVFLPDDYKIKKVAPESWCKNSRSGKGSEEDISLTLFLRIKFFLPENISNNTQGGEWRNRVYLQLRRATLEGQMISTIQNLIQLAGYALHIEFGEFTFREHGTADYFLLEHYLPEFMITNDMAEVKLRMKRAHESQRGLDKSQAIINYITLAQTYRDYGAHFYSAIWATRDGFCRDVWLSIGPRGVTLYSRTTSPEETSANTIRIVLQSLPWHHIRTFYYNKKSLYIIPNAYSGLSKIGIKYKLKMTDNKSYFAFWLASLHHRLYLKLYAKEDFINYLSSELSCPLKIENNPKNAVDCSNYQDSYNLAVRNPMRVRRPIRRRFKVDLFSDKKSQNKENEKPNTEELLRQILSPAPSEDSILQSPSRNAQGSSSNEGLSSSESSLPRRHGVKMGTRVFNGMKSTLDVRLSRSPAKLLSVRSDGDLATTHSDSDDLSLEQRQHCYINSMKLLPERCYSQNMIQAPTAYVLESPKVYSDVFNYDTGNESCINSSIFEKLDNMECVQGERMFVTTVLERDKMNALGLQVAEGSDGNVYIKSITPGSSADACGKLLPGDQIISVNGQTLLNLKYDKALNMLQSAPQKVELIVLQNTTKTNIRDNFKDIHSTELLKKKLSQSLASALDADGTDDELINEEAIKTIYALIKLTKEKVINKMQDKSVRHNVSNRTNLRKSFSENKVNEESDVASSQETTPHKKNAQKFNTWRGQLTHRPKRRPLSLSIPTDVTVPDDYLNEDNMLMQKTSLKSIKSSLSSLDTKSVSSRNVALPRNFGMSRRWLGPVRYPVTPCKNSNTGAIVEGNVVRRHFVYGTGDSDEEQIFL